MVLVWEDNMQHMIYADNKNYYVYNEEDGNKSDRLRRVTGGHRTNITAI